MNKLYSRYLILTFIFYINICSAEGHRLQFSQISTKDGLSQNTVRAILEDQKGFIWTGTLDGLNRYDGYRITPYKPQLGNHNSLIDQRIRNVFQDKSGYLWIKTYNNEFSCYSPIVDSFVKYTLEKELYFTDFHESNSGDIWLWGNTNGCLRIRKNGTTFDSALFITEKMSDNEEKCRFLFEDSKTAIWIGGDDGLYRITEDKVETFYRGKSTFFDITELNNKLYFTADKGTIFEYDLKRNTFSKILSSQYLGDFKDISIYHKNELLITTWDNELLVFNMNTRAFEKPQWTNDRELKGTIDRIVDKKGGIWIYNHSGKVWYYNQEKGFVKKMELIPYDLVRIIDSERYNILIDSDDLIWITTYGNGLFCYNPETDRLKNYKYSANVNSPASDYILSITEDRYGNIWVGSEYAGIIKIVKSNYDLDIIRPEKEIFIGRNNNVRTVYEDSFGNIWVGTKNGSLYLYNDNLTQYKTIFKEINPYALCEDGNGRIWVGTKGKGLSILDLKTHKEVAKYVNIYKDSASLSNNTIFQILRDNKNRMWIASFGGGINLARETESGELSFKRFFFNKRNRSYVRCLYQDTTGKMWAGTSNGILLFNPDELIDNPDAYESCTMNLADEYGLNCSDIKTIYEDEEGIVWIGTAGGGLNKYVPATKDMRAHFISYTTKDGLSGDFVSGILEDRNNNLWISSESGITKFDKENALFSIFQFSDKTYGNHFNENANIVDYQGYMLWGSLDGLLKINPQSFVYDENTPVVTLTSFYIYDQRAEIGDKKAPLKKSISYADQVQLNYKQNTFTIEFATLSLKDPVRNKYEYILENYDKQWGSISSTNTATYKNLPPGKYLFKVRGTNSDGIWSKETSQINIIITPPYWRSMVAYIAYFIFAVLILYFLLRTIYKFNQLNNNVEMEKELISHKIRFFTNISHEFRTPLTLIRGVVENLNDVQNLSPGVKRQIDLLGRNSTILTRLIDQLLEFRKIQNNVLKLDLEEVDIVAFSKDIFSNFQEMALTKNIDYEFISDRESYYTFIDRRKVDKILFNLLSNAFKFTMNDGHIVLSISVDDKRKMLLLRVMDNGVGIERDKQHLLFSRFMQINFSYAGTGIGLSLVKEFTDVHKGKIWYEENKTKGGIFNVELPTDREIYNDDNFIYTPDESIIKADDNSKVIYPGEPTENIKIPDIDDSTLSNYKMLVIDDNDDIRTFLVDEFSKYFMIDVAENGEKGLQKAIENNPDLIICDVMMTEMDGFEVTRRLKMDFQTCHIPIILLTAHSSIEHQVEGIESGADAYIVKPFSLKYLVARVFKLIEHREQLKKRFSNTYVLGGNLIASTDKDKEFLDQINTILDEYLDDAQFSVDKFAELANQRRTIFYKKVKGITGLSPNEFIKIKRLTKAAELLLKGEYTVSEVAYKVGYDDPFYFSKSFKAHYSCSPSKFGQVDR